MLLNLYLILRNTQNYPKIVEKKILAGIMEIQKIHNPLNLFDVFPAR